MRLLFSLLDLTNFLFRKSGTLRWHMEKTPAFFLVSIHSSSFPFFVSYSLLLRLIALFPFWDPKTIAKRNTFKCNFSLPFQIPNLGSTSWWVPSRDSPNSKWTVLSGQLFIQFRFTPRLNKVRGSFFLCWRSHQSDSYGKVFVRKSGTLRWHMEKAPSFFLVFFAFVSISAHFFFFDLPSSPFLFILLFLFCDPKLAKMNTF